MRCDGDVVRRFRQSTFARFGVEARDHDLMSVAGSSINVRIAGRLSVRSWPHEPC